MNFVKVALTDEVPVGQSKLVEVEGRKITIFNINGNFSAIDDTCTHSGGPLSEGIIDGSQVICPWHGAQFDVTTGKVLGGPASTDVRSYKVKVEGNEIHLALP